MILTNLEIQKLLKKRLISIEPNPLDDAYDSTAVDLKLYSLIRVFRTNVPGFIFDPSAPGYKAAELIRRATDTVVIPEQGWELPLGMLVLGWTKERIDLNFKGRVAARVEGEEWSGETWFSGPCHRAHHSRRIPGSHPARTGQSRSLADQIAPGDGHLSADY